MASIVRFFLAQALCAAACSSAFAVPLHAETVDESKAYRFEMRGTDVVLEVFDGGAKDNMAHIAKISDAPAQLWKLRRENGWYRLTTMLRGANMCLDVINRGPNDNQLMLTKCAAYSSQLWKLAEARGGLRLTTQMRGDKFCLDVMRDNDAVLMPCTSVSSQAWEMSPFVEKLVATADIASTQRATDANETVAPMPVAVPVAVVATPAPPAPAPPPSKLIVRPLYTPMKPVVEPGSASTAKTEPIVPPPGRLVASGPVDAPHTPPRHPTRSPYADPARVSTIRPSTQATGPETRYRAPATQLTATPASAAAQPAPATPTPTVQPTVAQPAPQPAPLGAPVVAKSEPAAPPAPAPTPAKEPASPATLSTLPATATAEPPIADGPVQPREYQLIQNRARANRFLSAERGPVESSAIDRRAWGAQWFIENEETYVRFQNRWQAGRYLNLQNKVLEVAKVEPGWQSAMWTMEAVKGDTYRICNRLQPDICLHTERGKIEAGRVDPKWQSAMWRVEPAPDRKVTVAKTWTPKKKLVASKARTTRRYSVRPKTTRYATKVTVSTKVAKTKSCRKGRKCRR